MHTMKHYGFFPRPVYFLNQLKEEQPQEALLTVCLLAGRNKTKGKTENTIPSPFCTRLTMLLAESRLWKDSATRIHIAQCGFNLTQTCPPQFSKSGSDCEIYTSPYSFPYPSKRSCPRTEKLGAIAT